MLPTILLYLCALHFTYKGVCGGCVFPEYLQSPLDEHGDPMPWVTKMWWLNLRHDPKLREKQEVYVQRSQIWSQRQVNRRHCDRRSRRVQQRATVDGFGSCSERYLLYNRTCLEEERYNRFKVIQYGPGRNPTFLCIRFVKRSGNVVHIFEGPAREFNDDMLCDERKLQMDEWPWIAPWSSEISNCPISGGFSFRTINRLTDEDFCADEWRKSRLEMDCSQGDGLNFIAPKGSFCNPFSYTQESTKLYCWAGWQQKHYTFLVVGEEKGVPQYCMRFPRDPTAEFAVIVYFSVLCPMQDDGMPPTGIEYHEMKMSKISPEKCVDDDEERCEHVMKKGHCVKEEKYAVHCPRACHICRNRQEMMQMQCPFSPKIHGNWEFIDSFNKEKVTINHTVVHFAHFGSFTCKERYISNDNLYKTVSFFQNGCSMRYTCLEFRRRLNNVMQFRVGRSYRLDASFEDMCQFQDPHYPVTDRYRSKNMKYLIWQGVFWPAYCGLESSIPYNGTIYGEPCVGVVSDWDEDACVTLSSIRIHSDTCTNLAVPMEYQCLELIEDHPLEQFLITKNRETGEFNCWVLTSFLCERWTWRYRALYKLDSPQCTSLAESACVLDSTPEALLYLNDGEKTKHCKPERTLPPSATNWSLGTPTTPSRPYHIPDKSGGSATIYQNDGTGHYGAVGRSSNDCNSIIVGQALKLVTIIFIVMYLVT